MEQHTEQTGFKEVVLRLIAIVGLIAVLVLGAWGIILLAFNVAGLFNGSVNFSNLFSNNAQVEQPANTDTTPSVTTTTDTHTTKPTQTTQTTTNTGTKPSAVYTAAPRVTSLYGLPDLSVSIQSVTSLSSVQGRTSVTFVVTNVGTNVAYSGWTFNANLPLINQAPYLYQSAPQQALYPGDKISFTLTYDDPTFRTYNNNPYCNTANGYTYCSNTTYPNYQYAQPQTCYTYNGYQNIAGPCPITYDQSGNPIYTNYNYQNYPYNQYPYNYNQNYYGYNRTITIQVDPQNQVPEINDYNNTASKAF
jgi:hypothetical protein